MYGWYSDNSPRAWRLFETWHLFETRRFFRTLASEPIKDPAFIWYPAFNRSLTICLSQVSQVNTRRRCRCCWMRNQTVRIDIWTLKAFFEVHRWCSVHRSWCVVLYRWTQKLHTTSPSVRLIFHGISQPFHCAAECILADCAACSTSGVTVGGK